MLLRRPFAAAFLAGSLLLSLHSPASGEGGPPSPPGSDRIVLRNGSELVGRIVGQEREWIRVAAEFGEARIRRSQIVAIHRAETSSKDEPSEWNVEPIVEAPASQPAPTSEEALLEESTPPPSPPPSPAARESKPPPPTPKVRPARRAAPPPSAAADPLVAFVGRYLWFLPTDGTFRLAFGAALLFALTLVGLLACRVADVEDRSFGRVAIFTSALFAVVAIGAEARPRAPASIALGALLFVAAWLLLARWILRAKTVQGLVVLACFLFCLLLGVLWSEVAHFALQPTL